MSSASSSYGTFFTLLYYLHKREMITDDERKMMKTRVMAGDRRILALIEKIDRYHNLERAKEELMRIASVHNLAEEALKGYEEETKGGDEP